MDVSPALMVANLARFYSAFPRNTSIRVCRRVRIDGYVVGRDTPMWENAGGSIPQQSLCVQRRHPVG